MNQSSMNMGSTFGGYFGGPTNLMYPQQPQMGIIPPVQAVPPKPEPGASIYVGNLDKSATEEELQNLFHTYGTISSIAVKKDHVTGVNRGFAFVNFTTKSAAVKACEALNFATIRERELKVNLVTKQEK